MSGLLGKEVVGAQTAAGRGNKAGNEIERRERLPILDLRKLPFAHADLLGERVEGDVGFGSERAKGVCHDERVA